MGAFDYLVAELTCPSCGTVSPADASTNIQTKASDEPQLLLQSCGDDNWVRVVLDAGRIASIVDVPLSSATFEESDYIEESDCVLLAMALTDRPFSEVGGDPIQIVRDQLAARARRS